jgi:hypothetical protein
MNFYAESVVLLWTTAMRFGHPAGRSQQTLPKNDVDLESRHDASWRERIPHRDGPSFINCSAKSRQPRPGQH